ncbi:MAG: GNAT family N-acetyltransferase [Actinobacteria bacterium]|nr:GNAT family N-acetyltransferase [Actinomycetota bacterium]
MRIREATPDDARAIAEVHVASWRWAYRGLIPDDFLANLSVQEREARWREGLSDAGRGCFVAEDATGGIVGFASYGPPEDEGAPEEAGEVYAIYLDEGTAGTGVGRELFAQAAGGLRDLGFDRAFLWVLAANGRARRFYEKAGWAPDGAEAAHRFDCANEPLVRYTTDLRV